MILLLKGKVVWGAHQGGGWGIGREWVKSSRVSATIIDVAQKKKAGFVSSVSTGEKGFMVPFVLIFPLPPIPWSSITMTPACEGLVKELLDFIQGKSVHLG